MEHASRKNSLQQKSVHVREQRRATLEEKIPVAAANKGPVTLYDDFQLPLSVAFSAELNVFERNGNLRDRSTGRSRPHGRPCSSGGTKPQPASRSGAKKSGSASATRTFVPLHWHVCCGAASSSAFGNSVMPDSPMKSPEGLLFHRLGNWLAGSIRKGQRHLPSGKRKAQEPEQFCPWRFAEARLQSVKPWDVKDQESRAYAKAQTPLSRRFGGCVRSVSQFQLSGPVF